MHSWLQLFNSSNSVLLEDLLYTAEPQILSLSPIFTPSDQRAALSLYNDYVTFTVLVASHSTNRSYLAADALQKLSSLLSFEMFYEH